jgi:Domain of unknown function (DUF222)
VFDEVRTAVATLEGVARDLEPGVLGGADAARLVEVVAQGEHVCAALKALLARRVEETGAYRDGGYRSAGHWLSAKAGVTVGAAVGALETARSLDQLHATAEAFRAGKLSETQARQITGAAIEDPSAEARLLRTAQQSTVKGLKDRCREVRAAAQPDDAAWARQLHEQRYLHKWTDLDGSYCGDFRLAPAAGARLFAALDAHEDQIFREARRAGRREPRDAYAADALVALMDDGPSKPVDVRLTADATAIERGFVVEGEKCEITGRGAIPVTDARTMLNDANVTTLLREGTEIVSVSSPTRVIPAPLRRWVETTFPVCGVAGCDVDRGLEIDHIIPVEQQGPTEAPNLWRLCHQHHLLKTHCAWTVTGRPGTWDLRPPASDTDPDPPP